MYIFIESADNPSISSGLEEPINLIDEFDSLNIESHWSHEIYIAQEPVCKNNIIYYCTKKIISRWFINYIINFNNWKTFRNDDEM